MAASQIPYSSDTIFLEKSAENALDNLTVSTKESISRNVSASAKLLSEIDFVLWNVGLPTLLIYGTFGNVMTMLVMRRMRASQSTACLSVYFTALAVSDQCILTSCAVFVWVFLYMEFSWHYSLFLYDLFCLIPKFLWLSSNFMSAWFLVALTYQRVTSVVAPHRVQILCTVRRGKIIVATIVVVACAMNSPFLFIWSYWPVEGQCQYRKNYLHLAELLETLDLVCTTAIPFILLATGNSVLIWQVIRSTQLSRKMRVSVHQQATSGTDKVHSMTITLILTSVTFLVLTLPICIFDVILQAYYTDNSDDEFVAMIILIRSVLDIMWMSASATNFYIYILSGSKFRQEAKRYLCCRRKERMGPDSNVA